MNNIPHHFHQNMVIVEQNHVENAIQLQPVCFYFHIVDDQSCMMSIKHKVSFSKDYLL